MSGPRIALILLFCILVAACSEDPQKRALAPYSEAVLIPGQGLGKLKLENSTLADVVDELGSGFVSIMVTDEETMIELAYLQRQLCLGFTLSDALKRKLDEAGGSRKIGRDLQAFMTEHPEARTLHLSSLSVGGSSNSFYRGATDKGVKLGSPASEAEVYKSGDQRIESALAGSSSRNGDFTVGEGIVLFRTSGSEATINRITVH